MPTTYTPEQITQNKITYLQAPELIANFLIPTNPFLEFHGMQQLTTALIQFTVKSNTKTIKKWDRNSAQDEASFVTTEVVKKVLGTTYTAGEQVAKQVLLADTAMQLANSMQVQVISDLNEQMYEDSVACYTQYTKKIDVNATSTGEVAIQDWLDGVIKAYNLAMSTYRVLNKSNIGQWQIWIPDSIWNLLTGLKGNSTGNLQAYNALAQTVVWNGDSLKIKGINCEVLRDDAFTDGTDTFTFYFTAKQFIKAYALQAPAVSSHPIMDSRPGQRILFEGEMTVDFYPYMTKTETDSRWGYAGKIVKAAPTEATE